MNYLLDADYCIAFFRGAAPDVVDLIPSFRTSSEVCLCTIVAAELLFGAKRSNKPQQRMLEARKYFEDFEILPFDLASAEVYGDIRATLAKSGTMIGANDLFIAAIALANNLTLVTSNLAEFSRVPNLQILNWRTP